MEINLAQEKLIKRYLYIYENKDLIIGMITGIVGLLICVFNYPVYSYLKSNKN